MTREEINDYIAEMQDQSGDYILRNWQRNAIADYCIEHQTDLLKEFVEFAKGEFIKANYCYNDTYLDTMLEMFMEERK